jgi:hypothetical protein
MDICQAEMEETMTSPPLSGLAFIALAAIADKILSPLTHHTNTWVMPAHDS